MYKTKSNMILPLITQLKSIRSPLNLRKKLLTSVKHGLNWTAIRSLKPWFLSVPSSLSYSQSSDSSETQASVQRVLTSLAMSKPMSPLTRSYVRRLDLNLTRPSTISAALRSHGAFSPLRGNLITSILSGNFWLSKQRFRFSVLKRQG